MWLFAPEFWKQLFRRLACQLKIKRIGAKFDFIIPLDGSVVAKMNTFKELIIIPDLKYAITG